MKRENTAQPEPALQIYTEDEPFPASKRLVMILPDINTDVFALPKRIWDLAAPGHCPVLLMLKPCREENEFHARMNLATLAAVIRDPWVPVQTQLVQGESLEQAAEKCAQPGDVFVCFAEHHTRAFMKKQRLAEILARATHQPVYTLKGKFTEMVEPVSTRLVDFLLLALCLVSLIVFFAFQVYIDRNSSGSIQTFLQILAVVVEVWIIGTIASNTFRV